MNEVRKAEEIKDIEALDNMGTPFDKLMDADKGGTAVENVVRCHP